MISAVINFLRDSLSKSTQTTCQHQAVALDETLPKVLFWKTQTHEVVGTLDLSGIPAIGDLFQLENGKQVWRVLTVVRRGKPPAWLIEVEPHADFGQFQLPE